MNLIKLNIQLFADGKVVIDTQLNAKNFENGLNRMQSATKKASSTIKNIVVGLGITKLFSTAFNTIKSSTDDAISRLDTLNNFPKVMSNLGISATKSSKSIQKMSNALAGLPTTLDQGASAVQRFTSKNGDVNKSTDLFLALNNAILAGGASSEIQASALEQLSQSYAKGKPDMMEWRTAMTAMPAQLKQVAKAMGYVNADELGESLRDGTVSMDEFMDTIIKLNKEGINGFQSFEKQARNSTGGIKTSITVAKTQIVKGVADIIEALNVKFEDIGLGSISEIFQKIGVNSKKGLDGIANLIKGNTKKIIIDGLKDFEKHGSDIIEKFTEAITNNIPKITNTAGDIIVQFINTLNANIPILYSSGVDIITTLVNSIAEQAPNLIPSLVETIIKLFMAISDPKNMDKISEAGANLVMKLIEGILNSIPELISNTDFMIKAFLNVMSGGQFLVRKVAISLMKSLIKGIIDSIPELLESGFKIIKAFLDKITSFAGTTISKGKDFINNFIKGIKDGGLNYIKEVGEQLINGLWQGIQQRWNELKSKVGKLGNSIVEKFRSVFGIKSPSRRFRDEIGIYLAQGMEVGFEDELNKVYRDMQKAINTEQSKLQANVETGKVFNSLVNTTPVQIDLDASVEMDSQKVGRIITPQISRTIKTGGGYQ